MSNIDMLGGSGFGMGMVVTDPRWTPTDVADPVIDSVFLSTKDIRSMDARLQVLNAAYWTQKRCDQESIWDKLFYIRSDQGTNPGGLS
jgi:hypothetical protein